MSEILDNIYIDSLLLLVLIKYILLQLYSYFIQNCTFWYFLAIVETCVFWRKYFQSILIFMLFCLPKNH